LLDAIYYLCMTKSHFNAPDSTLLRHEADFFRLQGRFQLQGDSEQIVCKVRPRKLKVIERNRAPYEKLSEHIGLLPVVFIAPDDTQIATEGSEDRRRFVDNTLSQLDQQYLRNLIQYNRLLRQRNTLLKRFADERRYEPQLLSIYDQQMRSPARYLHDSRAEFLEQFKPVFLEMHRYISHGSEQVDLQYRSALTDASLEDLLAEAAEKDRILQRTTTGPHRDDFLFQLEGKPLKRFASQGQLKSYILALKLAQYEVLRRHSGKAPILLLDDIFDKLDEQRVSHLLELLLQPQFGQLFITDTHADRVARIVQRYASDYAVYQVHRGQIRSEDEEE